MEAALPRLRPMNMGDLLDATFALYRRNFALFAGIAAVLGVPQAIINIAIALVRPPVPRFTTTTGTGALNYDFTGLGQSYALLGAGGIVGFLFGLIVTGALARAIAARYMGEPMTIKEAYASLGIGTFVTLLIASLVLTVGGLIAFFLALGLVIAAAIVLSNIIGPIAVLLGVLLGIGIVVGAIYLGVSFLFFPEVIVLERRGVFTCFSRSWRLVSGSWWRVFGIYIVLAILAGILTSVAGAAAAALLGFGSGGLASAAGAAINSIASILIQPFQRGALVLLYYDMRIRKEAFDLEQMARTLGTP